ncbi:ATP-dependent RNA helicase DBP8 [Hondaea fermentalgiana]|uniref:ATP-dependent RNA helicase DBP8 n=1 Tax=Hondaea fermentalgiana TaxID=2315210 RepID=A0A2R5G3K8_9STRA|nr:ATP-dependent RNA helicase DBP8 [Hondaea fermentalgiana]|eukprot:GBG25602.1 ATP-dependent RNA helicase DBP8 [Hondaea fermentalgiana]
MVKTKTKNAERLATQQDQGEGDTAKIKDETSSLASSSSSSSSDSEDEAEEVMSASVSLFSKKKKKKKKNDGSKTKGQKERRSHAKEAESESDNEAESTVVRLEDLEKGEEGVEAWSFEKLGLSKWTCDACQSLGMLVPTAVQRACIPATLAGKNIIGSAPTGSGKTAAFALPILDRLARDMYGVFAVVVTPTRELAFQIGDQFSALGAAIRLRCAVVVGGTSQVEEATKLARRPHIIVATPGRLGSHLRGADPPKLNHVAFLVLDEADRLIDPGFARDLASLFRALPEERQTLLYSATITEELKQAKRATKGKRGLFEFAMGRPEMTPEGLDERYLLVPQQIKLAYLAYLVRRLGPVQLEGPLRPSAELARKRIKGRSRPGGASSRKRRHEGGDVEGTISEEDKAAIASLDLVTSRSEPGFERSRAKLLIIFVSSCQSCQSVGQTLEELGLSCSILHSGLSQNQRMGALNKFRQRVSTVLVATDVASRGLDIPQVDLVINYDVPRSAEDYIHRVGRTARAGRAGLSVTLVTQYEVKLVLAVEERTGVKMRELPDVDEEKDVLVLLTRVTNAAKQARLQIADSGVDEEIRARRKQRRR